MVNRFYDSIDFLFTFKVKFTFVVVKKPRYFIIVFLETCEAVWAECENESMPKLYTAASVKNEAA